MLQKWAYCLSEEQYFKLVRNIKKVPGLLDYLAVHDDENFHSLLDAYKLILLNNGLSTPGIRTNMDLISNRYDLFQKEYVDAQLPQDNTLFDINRVLTWFPRPQWTVSMTVEEIDYLDHFLWQVEGLPEYLHNDIQAKNLYDKVCQYQLMLNAIGRNNPEQNFILETIKERFYLIMNDHKDAIHYVNHSHQMDDHVIINQFVTEAKDSFYMADLETNTCEDFLKKYQSCTNPFIDNEVFCKLFRANKIEESLKYAGCAFQHIFSSPNIYWNNKEAIYGSANLLNMIVEAMGVQGFLNLKNSDDRLASIFIKTLYLLLSRIIYWSDRETVVNEEYDDNLLPINAQHKIRAFRMRSQLVKLYHDILLVGIDDADFNMMELADLNSAHSMAFSFKIVGKRSVFLQDVLKVYHTNCLFKYGSIEKVANMGFELNDALSMSIHEEYTRGNFALSQTEATELLKFLSSLFLRLQIKAIKEQKPIPYLKKDHYSPSFKVCRNEIMQYLIDNGIKCLYHFTDKDRLESIIRHGGLFSYKRCLDEAIVMPVRDDMAVSRDIDAEFGLEDYARLSFCCDLPKAQERKNVGAELVLLKISLEVATFEDTVFTDMEATSRYMKYGAGFEDLKKVNIAATQKPSNLVLGTEYLQKQAEVLVKGIIPLKYILNIKNPEKYNQSVKNTQ